MPSNWRNVFTEVAKYYGLSLAEFEGMTVQDVLWWHTSLVKYEATRNPADG